MIKPSFILIGLAGLILFSCSNTSNMEKINTSTVENVDLNKYLGTWYEIARFPHSFEKGLVGVTANYSFRKMVKLK